MKHESKIFESELDPSWSIKVYFNGYHYFQTGNEDSAIQPMHVPNGVRKELSTKAKALMEHPVV